jgi:HEPN domain-containing protein
LTPAELRASEAREWLAKAWDDLGSARVLAAAGHDANALYHCQQAGEKSLKAYLTFHDQPFRKTHSLKELGESCSLLDSSLQELTTAADALTDYAWKLRYPGDPYVMEAAELEAMITVASRVLSEIQSRLPAAAREALNR